MKAELGRTYAQILFGKVHCIFTLDELPEWNENDIMAVDVTENIPIVGQEYKDGFFVPAIHPTYNDIVAIVNVNIENARNAAIEYPIISAALGSPHTYSSKAENRNFLNNLITLGNGGKFTCTDTDGVKQRRLHTHAQLLMLAHDIEAYISAQFDHYELKLAEIAAATTPAELDAIVW